MKLKEFEKIEREMQLDRSIVFNVAWWDLWRYSLYSRSRKVEVSRKRNVHLPVWRFFQGITRLKCFFVKGQSVVVLRHPRFKKEGHRYIDIYTDIIGRDLEELGYKPLYLEKSTTQSRDLDQGPVYPLDLIAATASLVSKLMPIFFLKSSSSTFIYEVLHRLGVSDPELIRKIIFRSIVSFKVRVLFYRVIIKLTKPRGLFLVVSCGNEDIICAAKKESVVSIELQHGSPTRGKMNYDYSNDIDKTYFPDFFLSFGQFFTNQLDLPSPCKSVINFGYPYLQDKYRQLGKSWHKKYDLLVLSQPDCDTYIVEFLKTLIKRLPKDFSILVQLHPQYFSKVNPYGLLECPNLEVADSIESSLYEAFSVSKSAITVYSTAIYEAKMFGLKAFVLSDERNYLREFLRLEDVVEINPSGLVDNNVSKIVKGIAKSNNDSLKLFSVYSKEKLKEVLNLIF